jgi:hypothetical protein
MWLSPCSYLASDESAIVTSHALSIDGAMSG